METVFLKARELVRNGCVDFVGNGLRGAYFDVRGDHDRYHVRISRDNRVNCTCKWGSLHGASHGSLCSHGVAAMFAYADGLERGDIQPLSRRLAPTRSR